MYYDKQKVIDLAWSQIGYADGPVYVSTMDHNVYEPDVYGWEIAV